MKVCGIIAEYNPFHNGHAYHVQMAREKTNADVIVAVMSGNFLQRGEPAIIDKWQRAQAAVANGVDLVIELPFEWAVQSADFFARGAIQLLADIGCTALCFGSDSSQSFDYAHFGQRYKENKASIQESFQQITDPRLSYAQKMMQSMTNHFPNMNFDENQPNHILALSYAKENAELVHPMELFAIDRKQAEYHSTELKGEIASATAIRLAVSNKQSVCSFVPKETMISLEASVHDWESLWPFLKYRLQMDSLEQLKGIYQMVDGLEYRLQKKANECASFSEFMESVSSKRYAKARVQRLCLYTLLAISTEQMQAQWQHPAIRPLAFNEKGKQILKQANGKLPIVSRFAKKEAQAFPLTLKADRMYQLANPLVEEQNFGRFAFLSKKP